jgi:methionyl-tRNA synthetase
LKLGKILVACAWPYVNHLPHLGTLLHLLSADVTARYYRMKGEDVITVSGSDEHGTPAEVEAVQQGISPKQLTNKNHSKAVELWNKWGFSFENYTRTENPVHKEFVKKHLMKIYSNGYVFEKEIKMLFCETCRRFLPDRYVEGRCPHCSKDGARGDQCDSCGKLLEPKLLIKPYCTICKNTPTTKKTKHWYLDLPKFSEKLTKFITDNKQFMSNTKNFSLKLIDEGLKPRAITRDVDWGIQAPFPGAENKTIYVWIEAVLGYVSATIEYFKNSKHPEKWKEYWFNENTKTLFFIGKDNIPYHTIIFPALLLASHENYNLPWNVSTTEFLLFKDEAFSKSRRIGIWIDEALELFPPDYWRYFLTATRPETKDTNFLWNNFIEKVNTDLNDTLGNFIHRTLKFTNTRFNSEVPEPKKIKVEDKKIFKEIEKGVDAIAKEIERSRLHSAIDNLINLSRIGNRYLNESEPWNLIKNDKERAATIIYTAIQLVKAIAITSTPFIPYTAEELWKILGLPGSIQKRKWGEATTQLPAKHKINKAKLLFQKIDVTGEKLGEMLENIRETAVK